MGHFPNASKCKQQFRGSKMGNIFLTRVQTLETKRWSKQALQRSWVSKKNSVFVEWLGNANHETERGRKGVVKYRERSEKPGGCE